MVEMESGKVVRRSDGIAKGRETYIPFLFAIIFLGDVMPTLAMTSQIQDTVISAGGHTLVAERIDVVSKPLPLRVVVVRIEILIGFVDAVNEAKIILGLHSG